MNKLKKIGMWFWTRNKIIQNIIEVNDLLDKRIMQAVEKFEELDQGKVYIIKAPGYTIDGLKQLNTMLKRIRATMKWTPPPILVMNADIKEFTQEQIDNIVEREKRRKHK